MTDSATVTLTPTDTPTITDSATRAIAVTDSLNDGAMTDSATVTLTPNDTPSVSNGATIAISPNDVPSVQNGIVLSVMTTDTPTLTDSATVRPTSLLVTDSFTITDSATVVPPEDPPEDPEPTPVPVDAPVDAGSPSGSGGLGSGATPGLSEGAYLGEGRSGELIYKVSWDISDGNNVILITTVKDDGFLSVTVRTAIDGAISARLAPDQPYDDRTVFISYIDPREKFVYLQAEYIFGRYAFLEHKIVKLEASIGEKIFVSEPGELTLSTPLGVGVRTSVDGQAATIGLTCEEGQEVVFKITDGSPVCVRSSSVERMTQYGWYAYSDPATIIPGTEVTQAARLGIICKEGYQLTFKISDGSAACALPWSAKKMVQNGWHIYSEPEISTTDSQLTEGARLATTCKEGYQLTFKTSDGSAICALPSSAEKMVQHGWYVHSESEIITKATP